MKAGRHGHEEILQFKAVHGGDRLTIEFITIELS